MAIFKYTLATLEDRVIIPMPKGAEILYLGVEQGVLCIWARVNTEEQREGRVFRIAGTGHSLESDVGKYLGTFFLAGAALVFHVFEISPQFTIENKGE